MAEVVTNAILEGSVVSDHEKRGVKTRKAKARFFVCVRFSVHPLFLLGIPALEWDQTSPRSRLRRLLIFFMCCSRLLARRARVWGCEFSQAG